MYSSGCCHNIVIETSVYPVLAQGSSGISEIGSNRPVRLHLRSSVDGFNYDTSDLYTYDCPVQIGKTVRRTYQPDANVKYSKVLVENFDSKQPIKDVSITATLGG